jgi:hypothetical protein
MPYPTDDSDGDDAVFEHTWIGGDRRPEWDLVVGTEGDIDCFLTDNTVMQDGTTGWGRLVEQLGLSEAGMMGSEYRHGPIGTIMARYESEVFQFVVDADVVDVTRLAHEVYVCTVMHGPTP